MKSEVWTWFRRLINFEDEKVVIISASDDKTLDVSKITLKRFTREVLPGGHHFDGDTNEIVKVIISNLD